MSQSVLQLIYNAAVTCLAFSIFCSLQAQRNLTGIMNYTNPGAVSHNEILQMYKDYIDPEFKWSNFSVEEQAKVIVAARSNNLLDTKRVSYDVDAHMQCRKMNSLLGWFIFFAYLYVFLSVNLYWVPPLSCSCLPAVFQPQVCSG